MSTVLTIVNVYELNYDLIVSIFGLKRSNQNKYDFIDHNYETNETFTEFDEYNDILKEINRHKKNIKENIENFTCYSNLLSTLTKQKFKLKPMFNPHGTKTDKDVIETIDYLYNTINDIKTCVTGRETTLKDIKASTQKLEGLIQTILKDEWDRIQRKQ